MALVVATMGLEGMRGEGITRIERPREICGKGYLPGAVIFYQEI